MISCVNETFKVIKDNKHYTHTNTHRIMHAYIQLIKKAIHTI